MIADVIPLTKVSAVFERRQTIAEYSRHLPDSQIFTLGQAFSALEQFYSTKCNDCEDDADGLVFLTGIFDDSPNFQIVLSRIYNLISQLTVTLQYENGFRSYITQKASNSSSERNESTQFFTDTRATRAFWLFKNLKPIECGISYIDADDRGDQFFRGFANLAAEM